MAMNFPPWSCPLCIKGHFLSFVEVLLGLIEKHVLMWYLLWGEVFGDKEGREQERKWIKYICLMERKERIFRGVSY